jgi:hypothetical protein
VITSPALAAGCNAIRWPRGGLIEKMGIVDDQQGRLTRRSSQRRRGREQRAQTIVGGVILVGG